MAKRDTYQKAVELKEKFEQDYGLDMVIQTIRFEEAVSPGKLSAGLITEDQIIRYDGKFPVIAVEQFNILEQKTCPICGEKYLTAAIGELGHHTDCTTSERDPRSDAEVRADARSYLNRSQAAEDWYE